MLQVNTLTPMLGSKLVSHIVRRGRADYVEITHQPYVIRSLTRRLTSGFQMTTMIVRNLYKISRLTLVARFHFCEPQGGPVKQPESLGSILFGDRILSSPYEINMMEKYVSKIFYDAELSVPPVRCSASQPFPKKMQYSSMM